jgi:tRNA G18 (ribose-2'-O)-methylase SpoU
MRKLGIEELQRDDIVTYKEKAKRPIVLVLDNIRSMHNVGAAFRTGDAFMIERIFLCGITAKPPHRDIRKSALGAEDAVDWQYAEKTEFALAELKDKGYSIVGVEQMDNSTMLQNFKFDSTKKYVFVFGNEAFGISEEAIPFFDSALEIPQFGTKHSINVSVSIGVVLWEAVRKTI